MSKIRKWFRRQSSGRSRGAGSMWKLGYCLALLGGVVIVILSLATLAHYPINLPFQVPLGSYVGIGVISLILGVVAVFGSKRVNELVWGIVLMGIGLLTGGIGGLLALLGGLVGLLARYA